MFKVIIPFMVISLLTAGTTYAEKEFSFHKTDNFDAGAVKSIRINIPSGEISFVKSGNDKVEINFKNIIYAQDQAEADKVNQDWKYEARIQGDRLLVTIEPPRRRHGGKSVIGRIFSGDWNFNEEAMLRVGLPDGKLVEVVSSSADIDAADLSLDLSVNSSSSDINFENTEGKLDCDISSGDIEALGHRGDISVKGNSSDLRLTDIQGNVDIATSSGDGNYDKIKGSLKIASSSGDNRISDIDGDLDVRVSSGDILVNAVSGAVRVEATSGDVNLTGLSSLKGPFDIESVSGDIQMEVSRDFQGEVTLRTTSGSVDSRLPGDLRKHSDSQIEGQIGSGDGWLHVMTVSGDINVDRF